jgi:hypothetical protein
MIDHVATADALDRAAASMRVVAGLRGDVPTGELAAGVARHTASIARAALRSALVDLQHVIGELRSHAPVIACPLCGCAPMKSVSAIEPVGLNAVRQGSVPFMVAAPILFANV